MTYPLFMYNLKHMNDPAKRKQNPYKADRDRTGCVILAAGNASRFGENKLTVKLGSRAVIEHAFDAVPAGLFEAVCVVTQYDEIEALSRQYGFKCIRNDRPGSGLGYTIRLGTEALSPCCGAILYMVSDQPLLKKESLERLYKLHLKYPDKIISAACSMRQGNPCIFPERYFPELTALTGDTGGKSVIRSHTDSLILCELEEQELTDIDTPEELESLKALRPSLPS